MLKSFHGDKAVKAKYVERLKAHHKADQIVQGEGWTGSRGCAVGCTLDKYSRAAYETELGLPEWLAQMEDTIFEGLPKDKAPKFAVDFLISIPVGVDVSRVQWQFCAFILRENIERVLVQPHLTTELREQVVNSIRGVLKLHEDAALNGSLDESAAWSAWSAWSAAWSAARSARSAAYIRYAKELIRLLKACK